MKEIKTSINYYNKALFIKKDYIDAKWNKALALLMGGQYLEGWKLYESRFQKDEFKDKRRIFKCPKWTGKESIAGKFIYIYTEQGYGDTIQFIRYIKLLNKLKAKIIIEISENIIPLLENFDGIVNIVTEFNSEVCIDYHCSLMSLPYAFRTKINTIPFPHQYIYANKYKTLKWRNKINKNNKLKIGLVWSGGTRSNQLDTISTNYRRNIPLEIFAKYFQNTNYEFYSLQKGEPAESMILRNELVFWPNGNFFNYVDELKDFEDTAALIENLDLVISVDTSTAHLSAAMGKNTWILNRYDSCWRWLIDRKDSPWYNSVTLYRQDETYNWENVLSEVREDLLKFKMVDLSSKRNALE